MEKKKQPYFGSVRFFKHVILLCLFLLIAIPSALCILLGAQNSVLRVSASELSPFPEVSVAPAPTASPEPAPQPAPTPLAAEFPPWQDLYPELYAAPCERSTLDEEKAVYLTFDDGPSERTPEILKILDEYGVKATFFVVGKSDEQSQQWMRDIVAAGHTIGMHSYTHNYKQIYSSAEAFLEDYNQIYNLIYEATGVYPQISRFPGGSINGYNGSTYRDIISELVRRGFVYFDWNVANGDAAETGFLPAKTLAKNALANIASLRRAVILMHDSAAKKTTVEALPAIIQGYLDAGFTFQPLTPEVVPVVYTYPS
ncbi:MAG: polysaccharide deacetylase [Clostridia bacterium]|nr:polysaccharide deacetylase [Clostridia bacterium]